MGKKNKYKPNNPEGSGLQGTPNQTGSGDQSPGSSQSQQLEPLVQQQKPRQPPQRGTLGLPGIAETNYLRLSLKGMPDIAYHYAVDITPDIPKHFMRQVFEQFAEVHFKNITMVFDGSKNCYTVEKLPINSVNHDVVIHHNYNRILKCNVTIKETETPEIELKALRSYYNDRIYDKPMRAMQCLDVVLASACHARSVRVGRSYYVKPQQICDITDGYELWSGLYQSCILGDEVFLNVDISHKLFLSSCSILDYMRQHLSHINLSSELSDATIDKFSTFVEGIRVVYTPPACFNSSPRLHKVSGISSEPATRLEFALRDGTVKTVARYFEEHNAPLKYSHLQCLKIGKTNIIYLPVEFCSIPSDQACNKRDEARQVQLMAPFAATSTNIRKERILQLMQHFKHNMDSKIAHFGLKVDENFLEVPTRLLMVPKLKYGTEIIIPNNGSWRLNECTQFLSTKKPANGHKWALIYPKRSSLTYHIMHNFAEKLSQKAKSLNMFLAEKPDIDSYDIIDNSLSHCRAEQYDLVIVVIPKSGTTYSDIKQCAELKYGILTQCIKQDTIIRRVDNQVIVNLLLKINGKLNGTNHCLAPQTNISIKKVMYIGADVTHPRPEEPKLPSVVGVAASHDSLGTCYNMQYRLQRPTAEIIEDMESVMSHHLSMYYRNQKSYPDHIIYYRDGVGDGDFPRVKDKELSAMRLACQKVRCNPKITCIVVVKRHHTRFFPKKPTTDKYNNVPPGTVVDRVIVHPNEMQFFLVSHQSIQGTARPTRYVVIDDEAKLNIDDIQKMTYNLCHIFPRCNRSVSYPVPAYLAHLVAIRGRVYLEGTQFNKELPKEHEKRLIHTRFMEKNPMYFI